MLPDGLSFKQIVPNGTSISASEPSIPCHHMLRSTENLLDQSAPWVRIYLQMLSREYNSPIGATCTV